MTKNEPFITKTIKIFSRKLHFFFKIRSTWRTLNPHIHSVTPSRDTVLSSQRSSAASIIATKLYAKGGPITQEDHMVGRGHRVHVEIRLSSSLRRKIQH